MVPCCVRLCVFIVVSATKTMVQSLPTQYPIYQNYRHCRTHVLATKDSYRIIVRIQKLGIRSAKRVVCKMGVRPEVAVVWIVLQERGNVSPGLERVRSDSPGILRFPHLQLQHNFHFALRNVEPPGDFFGIKSVICQHCHLVAQVGGTIIPLSL